MRQIELTFLRDSVSKIPSMDTFLTDIEALNSAGASPEVIGAFVIYDLPDRDCAAAASNGEFTIADNGIANYFGYIDNITAIIKAHSNTNMVLVIGETRNTPSHSMRSNSSQNPTVSPTSSPI